MLADAMLRILNRRSIENPSTPLSDPDAWLLDLAGGMADSGVRVNRQTVLTYAAVYRAMFLISSVVGKVPLNVYRYTGDSQDSKERDKSHPADRVLFRKPCGDMTAMVFRQTLQAHVLTHGNGYAYIQRDGAGRPLELWPLLPSETYPLRVNRRLWYVTSVHLDEDHVEQRKVDGSDVLHIKGLGYDGLAGYSVIDISRQSMGLGMAAAKYQSKFFSNNAEPRIVVEVPGDMKLPAQQEFLRQWNAMHAGLDNAHKTAILTHGAKVNPFSLRAKDAQLMDARKFERTEVALWFGLPPHKLGDDSRTAYNSLEMEERANLNDCYDTWLVNWEQECEHKLLTEEEQETESHCVRFTREALVQADTKTTSEILRGEVNDGLITVDEARAKRHLPALPDGIGSIHRMPSNLVLLDPANPPGKAGEMKPPEGETKPAEGETPPAADETTEPAPIATADDAAKAGQVQGTALNGAQITGLLAIVGQIVAGEISADAGKALIAASFPLMTEAQIGAIVDKLEVKEDEPPAEPAPVPGQPPAGGESPPPPPPGDQAAEADRAARRAVVMDAATRAVKRLANEARRGRLDADLGPVLAEILGPAALLSRGRPIAELVGRVLGQWRSLSADPAAIAAYERTEPARLCDLIFAP